MTYLHFTRPVAPAASQRRTTPSREGEGFPLRPYSGATPGRLDGAAFPAPTFTGTPPRGVDVKEGVSDPGFAKKAIFGEKWPKMPKCGYLPAFRAILTESRTISKNRNRRGFQSNPDFLSLLRIRTPGDPGNGDFRDFGVPKRGFYINPSRRGPAVPGVGRGGFGAPAGPRGVWKPGPSGTPGLRDPSRDPGGLRGGRREGLM